MRKVHWLELTTEEFATLDPEKTIAVLPIAAIEQHGPHLAVSTDTIIGQSLIDTVIAKLSGGEKRKQQANSRGPLPRSRKLFVRSMRSATSLQISNLTAASTLSRSWRRSPTSPCIAAVATLPRNTRLGVRASAGYSLSFREASNATRNLL